MVQRRAPNTNLENTNDVTGTIHNADFHKTHQDDITTEDHFVRISKSIGEEIISVQARLIALEKRNDVAAQHEIDLLTKQIDTLDARKSDYETNISALQQRISAFRKGVQIGKAPEQLNFELSNTPTEKAENLVDKIRRRNAEQELLTVSQLPIWPEPMRGVPNSILRSALFGATRRGKRRYMERELVPTVDGVSLIYTGPRLDQVDLDVWEGALHLARLVPLGDRIEFTEKGFLKLMNRGGVGGENIGKSDREWLRKTLARLKANAIEISQGPYVYAGSLLDEYFKDESTGRYVLMLNPRMKILFGRDGWTQIDWEIRQHLRGFPLAQWLHGFYSTHARPFPLRAETIHQLCGSEAGAEAKTASARNKAIAGWRDDTLTPALDALVEASSKAGQVFSWKMNGELIDVSRTPTNSQKKHLWLKTAMRKSAKAGGG